MSPIDLSQNDADHLISMQKKVISKKIFSLPDRGGKLEINLSCENNDEDFIVNYNQHSINLSKRNHQLRGKKVTPLIRLDLDGPGHRNPNGEEVGIRHLHLYREEYGLKWAFEVPSQFFSRLDDAFETLHDFLVYCNVTKIPKFQRGLFT